MHNLQRGSEPRTAVEGVCSKWRAHANAGCVLHLVVDVMRALVCVRERETERAAEKIIRFESHRRSAEQLQLRGTFTTSSCYNNTDYPESTGATKHCDGSQNHLIS